MHVPYDVARLIFDMATSDTSWEEYPPLHIGYLGSPLAAAMNISQLSREWRNDILADEALWGRLLNTAYFPTTTNHNNGNALWNLVLGRAGDKPIWLRHVDRTPFECSKYSRLSERQIHPFRDMFLVAVDRFSPDRIQRLELDMWHMDLYRCLHQHQELEHKIWEAMREHTTHLKLSCSRYSDALETFKAHSAPGSNQRRNLAPYQMRYIKDDSRKLLGRVLNHWMGSMVPEALALKELRINAMALCVEDLLHVLPRCPNLEAIELCVGTHFVEGMELADPGSAHVVRLQGLREFRLESTVEMGIEHARLGNGSGGGNVDDLVFDFSVEGMFKKYCCRREQGMYSVNCVEDLPR